jgi:hypothetical protein
MGILETMARADLEALTRAVAEGYLPGSADRLAERDPGWQEALARAEADVGTLYAALCEADATLLRWRQAVAELYRLWSRARDLPADDAPPVLEEVA